MRLSFQLDRIMLLKLLVIVTVIQTVYSLYGRQECILSGVPKTRYFPTLERYQGNTLSFNPHNPGFDGNSVEFTFNTIDKLPRNAFYAFHSNYIVQLTLSGKNMSGIDDGAFNMLECVHFLNLNHNRIRGLNVDTFLGLNSLTTLDLSHNSLTSLQGLTFSRVPMLKELNLNHNEISSLHQDTFFKLNNLFNLDLSFNMVRKVHNDVFNPLNKLIELNLSHNRLIHIEPEKWTGLETLKSLNLADNSLISFDPSYNFSFSKLETLNVSSNYLTVLNVFALRQHFPLLNEIDLNGNYWKCSVLELIRHQLSDSRILLVGRNNSVNNVMNISCSVNEGKIIVTSTEAAGTTTMRTTTRNTIFEGFFNESLSNANRRMDDVLESVQEVKSLLVYLLILTTSLILLYLVVKLGVFQVVCSRFNGRQDGYAMNEHLLTNYTYRS